MEFSGHVLNDQDVLEVLKQVLTIRKTRREEKRKGSSLIAGAQVGFLRWWKPASTLRPDNSGGQRVDGKRAALGIPWHSWHRTDWPGKLCRVLKLGGLRTVGTASPGKTSNHQNLSTSRRRREESQLQRQPCLQQAEGAEHYAPCYLVSFLRCLFTLFQLANWRSMKSSRRRTKKKLRSHSQCPVLTPMTSFIIQHMLPMRFHDERRHSLALLLRHSHRDDHDDSSSIIRRAPFLLTTTRRRCRRWPLRHSLRADPHAAAAADARAAPL